MSNFPLVVMNGYDFHHMMDWDHMMDWWGIPYLGFGGSQYGLYS